MVDWYEKCTDFRRTFRCDNEIFYVGTGGNVSPDKTGTREETGCNGNERIIYKI